MEGLYQALFSFRHARRNVIYKSETKIEPDLRLEMRFNGSNLRAFELQNETFYRRKESTRNDMTVADSSGRAL